MGRRGEANLRFNNSDGSPSGIDSPERCKKLTQLIGKAFMWLSGWKVEGLIPARDKLVIIAAPHTSNWDFVYLLGAAFHLGLKVKWLGKRSLFSFPFGKVMKYLGGISVDRTRSTGMVEQVAENIGSCQKINLVIPPSGTRDKTEFWKSGFYYIAKTANVSLVCGYLDYEKKIAGLGPNFFLSDSLNADMNKIRRFYVGKVGKYPSLASVVRLKEELGET